MNTEVFDPNAPFELNITPKAINYFRTQLEKQADKCGVKISIKKSGCSGFKYDINFISEIDEQDEKFSLSDKLNLFISGDAKPFLRGTQIDFVTEGLNQSIKFNNPNAKDLCGCGESFSL